MYFFKGFVKTDFLKDISESSFASTDQMVGIYLQGKERAHTHAIDENVKGK